MIWNLSLSWNMIDDIHANDFMQKKKQNNDGTHALHFSLVKARCFSRGIFDSNIYRLLAQCSLEIRTVPLPVTHALFLDHLGPDQNTSASLPQFNGDFKPE